MKRIIDIGYFFTYKVVAYLHFQLGNDRLGDLKYSTMIYFSIIVISNVLSISNFLGIRLVQVDVGIMLLSAFCMLAVIQYFKNRHDLLVATYQNDMNARHLLPQLLYTFYSIGSIFLLILSNGYNG